MKKGGESRGEYRDVEGRWRGWGRGGDVNIIGLLVGSGGVGRTGVGQRRFAALVIFCSIRFCGQGHRR